MTGKPPMDRAFVLYFVRVALGGAAACAAVLALTVVVNVLADPGGAGALAIVLVGLALAIGALALVSKALTARLLGPSAGGGGPAEGPESKGHPESGGK